MLKKLLLNSLNFSFLFKVLGSVILGFLLFVFPLQFFVKLVFIIGGIFYLKRVGFYG